MARETGRWPLRTSGRRLRLGVATRLGLALGCCGGSLAMSSAFAQPADHPNDPMAGDVGGPGPAPTPPSPSTTTAPAARSLGTWYGYQILIGDAAAVATAAWAGERDAYEAGLGVAATLFVVDGAAVHLLHHHPVRALASAGLRLGVPSLCMLAAGGIAAATSGPQQEGSTAPWLPAATMGLFVGILGAIIADDGFLAWDQDAAPTGPPQAAAVRRSFTIAPQFSMARDRERGDRATVSLAGTF